MTVRISSVLPAFAVGVCVVAASCLAGQPSPFESAKPMLGTADHGHTYPGASVPFGMVQLSPDTRLTGWDGCSGYHWSDKVILGFSHTHLSGTGCPDLGDIRVTPISGELLPPKEKNGYHCRFSHDDETAEPGFYRVVLQEPKIVVELTASAHAGLHSYTFPADKPAHLVIDLARGIGGPYEGAAPIESVVTVESNSVVSGLRRSKGWAADKTYYFVAEFSRPFDSHGIDVDGKPASDLKHGKGVKTIAHVDFKPSDEPLLVKVGISPVSIEGARKNLAEIPGWDFAAARAAAKASWEDLLGRIAIQTDDVVVRESFYSALYHTALAPTLFNDADGAYCGLDHKAHPAQGFQNYCTFSLWDTFRAEHPLLTIIQPQRVDDFVNSMLAHYREFGKHNLPVWSLAGNETWCMIGNHAIPVIVEAYVKGFRGFNAETAFEAIRDTSMQDRNELGEYRKLGYITSGPKPKPPQKQSVSRTVEYAYDDWCIAKMATLMGKTEDAATFSKRAQNFRNVFDPSVGFVRGRFADGTWRTPFDPAVFLDEHDFTEGNSWNYTFFVPHDLPALVQLIGGDEAFVAKLNKMFEKDHKPITKSLDMLGGLIGQYVHGNEPCHHIPYLYCYAGAPWKTQELVRRIMTTFYNNKVDGLCGNEDCGQMSAWYVLSAIGIYPVNPSSGVYVIGSPMVDRATIRLDPKWHKGREFAIVAENNSPKNVYVQSATLNGKPLTRCWLSHAELTAGGELVLKMGPRPNPDWAKRPEDRPPVSVAAIAAK